MTELHDNPGSIESISPQERVLLISYCLRPSPACPGKLDRTGVVCPESCTEDCVVGRLRRTALDLGYKGVCIAAGGSMALKFVGQHRPQGIVGVACAKELAEGVEGVQSLLGNDSPRPALAGVPLTRDGCVNTEVDEEQATRVISAGCDP